MSSSPPGDAPLPAPSSSSLSMDSSDTAPVLPPLNLSLRASDGLSLAVHNSSSPSSPLNGDSNPSVNLGLITGSAKPAPASDNALSPPLPNSHLPPSSSSPPSSFPAIPIPVSVTSAAHAHINASRTFIMSSHGVGPDSEQGSVLGSGIDIESLPPEITKADLFIAPDGSFVQTSSALAARELKKSYDKILRVGHRDQVVRSPYAITAVEDETGAKVFRISRRDDDNAAPTLSPDHSATQPPAPNQAMATSTTSSRRKARLSVQDFLPSGMFKPSSHNNNTTNGVVGVLNSNQGLGGASASPGSISNPSPSSPPPNPRRKLRKTRSNSDMHSRVTQSPPNSTEAQSHNPASRYTYGYDTSSIHPAFEIRDELTAGADPFSQVLGWVSELATDTGAIASSSRRKGKSISGVVKGLPNLIGNGEGGNTQVNTHNGTESTSASVSVAVSTTTSRSRSPSAPGTASANTNAAVPRRPSVSTSAALSNVSAPNNTIAGALNNAFFGQDTWHTISPFGENVKYTTPLRVSSWGAGEEVQDSPLNEDPLPQPPQLRELREMQSFESGLTARVGDIGFGNGRERNTSFESDTGTWADSSEPGTPKFLKGETEDSENHSFSSDSNTWLHFSTRVFDVIQTYKGLPLPSSLLSAPPTGATIKITATESANPKDDPRFVIWGEVYDNNGGANAGGRDDASMSVSMSGSQTESNATSVHTHSTPSASSVVSGSLPPRKRSNARPPDQSSVVTSEAAPQTVIIAATVERWIAQLTSELDYDELLNFLLTYRTYITPIDLCHLLICRFHWALEKPTSKQDEMVRRIIRVRTFIAIRYWLLTFFREDFLPNSTLCTLFTTWLNSLFRDLSIRGSGAGDALSIVRKLKKVVRECKAAHSRQRTDAAVNPTDPITDDSDVDLDFSNVRYMYSSNSADGGMSEMGIPTDLGFGGVARFGTSTALGSTSSPGTVTSGVLLNSHHPPTSPNTLLLSQPLSKTILDHVKSPKPGTDAPLAQAAAIGTLPLLSRSGTQYHNSAISRAFVNTIGRLGRWKRVLNARASVSVGGVYPSNAIIGHMPHHEIANSSPGSASSLTPTSTVELASHTPTVGLGIRVTKPAEELLHVKGGVEEYLKMLKLGPHEPEAGPNALSSNAPGVVVPFAPTEGLAHAQGDAGEMHADFELTNDASVNGSQEDDEGQPYPTRPPGLDIPSPSLHSSPNSFSSPDLRSVSPRTNSQAETDRRTTAESSTDSASVSAFSYSEQGHMGSGEEEEELGRISGEESGNIQWRNEWTPDVVSLDDYDLSSSESELSADAQRDGEGFGEAGPVVSSANVGVGVRKGKTTRRLPLRREFQFVRGSGGSVSSLGIQSRSSFVPSVRSRSGSRERESERIDSVISSARAQSERHRSRVRSTRSSFSSSSHRTTSQSSISHGGDPNPHFQQWQIELISDDEDEGGDAEAALRRLEGQIDVERQREKELKVGRWLRTARARPPEGIDFSAEGSRRRHGRERGYSLSAESVGSLKSVNSTSDKSIESTHEEEDMDKDHTVHVKPVSPTIAPSTTAVATNGPSVQERDRSGSVSSTASVSVSASGGYISNTNSPAMGAANAVYPRTSAVEARRPSIISRMGVSGNANGVKSFSASNPTTGAASIVSSPSAPSAPLSGPTTTIPYAYRSFILLHRSELLAQQFMIIEAEIFKRIKFEEIIAHQWGQAIEDVNVRDWVTFVKERARVKNTLGNAGSGPGSNGVHANPASMVQTTSNPKLSSILALRARFDLVVNFIASEVVLSHATERIVLVEKIIRVAWKMYLHNNFNTLVAIISGLQTRWVNKAMGKKWNKVGMWEQRIFEDLKRFASREGEFKYIRNATAALIDQRPLGSGTEGGTVSSPSVTGSSVDRDKEKERSAHPTLQGHPNQQQPHCLPFLGAYLAQLYAFEKLPDFIDPTAPTEAVLIDITTGSLSPPSHPEVFFNLQPLPENITLEPLINVHKQRLIAGVIKAFVGAQHLAACVPFRVDERCYQKCLRIRSLETDVLQSLLGREGA